MTHKLQRFIFSLFFIFVNTIYLVKYGFRYDIPLLVFVFGYAFVQLLILFFEKHILAFLSKFNLKIIYFSCILIGFATIIFLTKFTDRHALNVDRWSAMEVAIQALFSGEYPYTAIDHLGGRTSNFPGLLLLGIPFYLLGDVGYFQAFSFLLFAFTLYKVFTLPKALYTIILIFISLPFWYEIMVISDFMSNMICVVSFIMLWNHYFSQNTFHKSIALAILSSILLLTRGIAYIPIALYLTALFFKTSFKKQISFLLASTVTFIILIFIVLINCPDIETLTLYNPLLLQTSYTSGYTVIFALLSPLMLSFRIKTFYNDFFLYSWSILSAIVVYVFIQYWINVGFDELIYNSVFDVAYLACVFPFLWILLGNNKPFKSPLLQNQ